MRNTFTTPDDKALMKRMLLLAGPVMLSNLLETLYNITDSFFLGRVGREALAAPAVANSVVYLVTVAGMAFSSSGLTLIAQAKGRGDHEATEHYLGQAVLYSAAVSAALSVFSLLLLETVLTALGVPADTRPFARQYMGIVFAGFPFMFIAFAFKAAMQGAGDTLTPLLYQGGAILLNLALDPIFIFGAGPIPAFGVRGAAFTTVFSQAITAVLGLRLLISGRKGLRLRLRHLKPDRRALAEFLRIGIPVSIGQGLTAMGFTVLQRLVNTFGSAVVAAAGLGDRIVNLFIVPVFGISTATASITGQYIGSGDRVRARKAVRLALLAGGGFIATGMTVTFFAGGRILGLFTPDPEVIAYGQDFFRFVSPAVVVLALGSIANGAFQGGGRTVPVMVLAIVRLWGIRVPLSHLLSLTVFRDPVGIWIASAVSNIVPPIAALVLLRRGSWLSGRVGPGADADTVTFRDQEECNEP